MQNNTGNTFFISGGGTGGHIYPAFTIAAKLLEDKNNKVYYIGCRKNLEYEIAAKYPDIVFLDADVTGMPRKISFSFAVFAYKLIAAWLKTIFYMLKYKPDAVFATGGYVSAPVILAAKTLHKPYMIHDCDSVPGLVSKFAAPGAEIVSAAFESSKQYLKSKNIIVNGNPARKEFFTVSKEDARGKLNIPKDKKVILAMGGSQGAKTINTAVSGILKTLSEDINNFVILQTGKKNFEEVTANLEAEFPEYKNCSNILIRPYFDDMVLPMKAADIIIARAGSLSLTEIMQCGAPSILIPYPYAAQNHQRKNALEMCEKGLSLYLEDSDCTPEALAAKINELDTVKIKEMSSRLSELSKINSAEEITNQLKSIIKH